MRRKIIVWANRIKQELVALYLAARDPRTSWYAKGVAIATVAYAVSPIDLIPDFIPVLGYLDDLLLVPLGIWLAIRLIPPDVMEDSRRQDTNLAGYPGGRVAAGVVVLIWFGLSAAAIQAAYRIL